MEENTTTNFIKVFCVFRGIMCISNEPCQKKMGICAVLAQSTDSHFRMIGRMPVSPGKRSFLGPARVKHDLFYVNAPASPENRRFFGLLPEPFKQIIHGEHNMKNYRRGLAAGIPIALGYLSVSFTFGIMAVSYGLAWWQAVLISTTTVTSAGQFAGIGTMMHPGQYIQMLISQITINIRYSFMSISIGQKADSKFSGIYRWLLGFMMTDEIFAVASQEESVTRSFFAGLATLPYIGWAVGTLLGAILGSILPDRVMSALSLAIYGMFTAIVVPEMKRSRPVIFVVILAIVLSCIFYYIPLLSKISSGITITVVAVVSAIIAALLFPAPDEETTA